MSRQNQNGGVLNLRFTMFLKFPQFAQISSRSLSQTRRHSFICIMGIQQNDKHRRFTNPPFGLPRIRAYDMLAQGGLAESSLCSLENVWDKSAYRLDFNHADLMQPAQPEPAVNPPNELCSTYTGRVCAAYIYDIQIVSIIIISISSRSSSSSSTTTTIIMIMTQ